VDLPAHISDRIRDVVARGGGTPIDEEARSHGAIALSGSPGLILMLRPDGTFWAANASWRKVAPVADEWRIRVLVWGVERFPWLAELLPQRPSDAPSCSDCGGKGHLGNWPVLCAKCDGLGWTPSNSPS